MQRNEKSRDELSFSKNELQAKHAKRYNFFRSKQMLSDNRHDRQQNMSCRKEGAFSRCGNEHCHNILSSPRKNRYDERHHSHPFPQRTSPCIEHFRDNFSLPSGKHELASPTCKIQLTDTMSPYRRVAKYDQTYSSLRKVHGINFFPLDQSCFEKYIQDDVAYGKNNLSNCTHDHHGQVVKRRMSEEQSLRKNQRSEKYNRNYLSPEGNKQKSFTSTLQRNQRKNAFLRQNNRILSRKNRHPVINSSPCQYHNVGRYRQNSKSPFAYKWANNLHENLSSFKNQRCNELPRNQSSSDKYSENKESALLEDRCSDRYLCDERSLCRKDRQTDPYPSNDISRCFDRYSERSSSSIQFIQNHKFPLHHRLSIRKNPIPPNYENQRTDNCHENHAFKKERHLNVDSEDDSFLLQRHSHVHKYTQNEPSSRQITNRPKSYKRTISPKRNDRKRSTDRSFKYSSDDLRQKIGYKGKRDRAIKYDKMKDRIQVEVVPTEQFQHTYAMNVKENKGYSKKQVPRELSPLFRQIRFNRNKVEDSCTLRRDVSDRQDWKTENSSRNKSSFESNQLGKPLRDEPFSGNNRRKKKFAQENSSPQRARFSRFKRRYKNSTLSRSRSPLPERKHENQSRSRKHDRTKDVSPPQHNEQFFGTILKNSSSRHSVHKPFRGVEQTEQIREKLKANLYEMLKPVPKYVNDLDSFNKLLKDQEKLENPMLKHIQKRKMMKEAKTEKVKRIKYQSRYPQKRFGI